MFFDRAIKATQKAIEADQNERYQAAYDFYMEGLEFWQGAVKWEKNEAIKAQLKERMIAYFDRALKLKSVLDGNGGKEQGSNAGGRI